MKLLVVSQYFFPENFRINDLVADFVARGHEVTVLTGMPNYPNGYFFEGYGLLAPRQEVIHGARVMRVPLVPRGLGGALRLVLNYISFGLFASWSAIFRVGRGYDAVFVFAPSPISVVIPGLIAGWRCKAPVLLWVLDLWPESLEATGVVRSPVILSVVGRIVGRLYKGCSRILVGSYGFSESVMALGVNPRGICHFPNWVEAIPDSKEGKGPRLPDGFTIVFAGNLGRAQDFPSILSAVRLTRDIPVQWVFVGGGLMTDTAKQLVERESLQDRVHFLGRWPLEDMPALFAGAAALLVSLRNEPAFAKAIPGKIQSYLAAGRPILAMIDGEGGGVVQKAGAGLVCGAGRGDVLAENVRRLFAMSEAERLALGESGKRYAQQYFDRDLLLGKLSVWIDDAVKEHKHG